jgi:hypothetical protein
MIRFLRLVGAGVVPFIPAFAGSNYGFHWPTMETLAATIPPVRVGRSRIRRVRPVTSPTTTRCRRRAADVAVINLTSDSTTDSRTSAAQASR